jgi:MtN3 and saliva related transmembrane protein
MDPRIIGWFSAAVLVATLARQVWEQWDRSNSRGVSSWLFFGQFVASTGMLLYSMHLGDLVFVVTNALMMVTAVAGGAILLVHRRRERGASARRRSEQLQERTA